MVAMLQISCEAVVNLESEPRVEAQGRLNTWCSSRESSLLIRLEKGIFWGLHMF